MNALTQALGGGAFPHDAAGWNVLIAAARAELLLGSLAYRLENADVPPRVAELLADARSQAEHGQVTALWEAEMARRALAPVGCPVILLKGTAYAAAGFAAGRGRSIGDLDILVPRDALPRVEAALLGAGWEWVKPDAYDDAYYRTHMHELPPLIHRDRDRMIDVHHTILPLTSPVRPDAEALVADSVVLPDGLRVLSDEDMIVHAAAHLFADGDLSGGLRNLWDIHCLCRQLEEEFEAGHGYKSDLEWPLRVYADHHELVEEVDRATRLSEHLFGSTPVKLKWRDHLFLRRLLARDGWGRETRRLTRLGFYVRSHWLRMPPLMLARHLWTKARR